MYYWMNCDNIYLLWVAVFTPYWNFEYTEDLYTTWSWWEVKSAQYMTPWQCETGIVLPVVQMSSLATSHHDLGVGFFVYSKFQ